MQKILNLTSKPSLTLQIILQCSVVIFLASFVISPTSKIINNIFYFIVIPSVILHYGEISFKDLYSKYKWIFGFLIYFWLSSFWSSDFEISKTFGEFKNVLYLSFFILSIDLCLQKTSNDNLFKFLLYLSVCISIVIIFNLIYFYTHNPISTRMHGLFALGHEIKSVWILGPIAIFMLHYIINNDTDKYSALFSVLVLPILAFIILTQSRGPLIALFVAVGVMLVKKNNYKVYLALGILALIYLAYYYFIGHESRGLSFRNDIWMHFINKSLDNLWLGHGILADKTFSKYGELFRHPHNVFLSILFHGGIVGVILFGKIIIDMLFTTSKYTANQVLSCLNIIMIFTLVCFLTDGSLPIDSSKAVWINFWVPVILIYYFKGNKKA